MIPAITEKIMDQRPSEYRAWTAMCVGMGVQSYVELGMGGGGANNFMKKAGVRNIVAVELLHARSDWNVVLDPATPIISANSYDPETPKKVYDVLKCWPDVVFIDADHSAEAVQKDFDLWWPLATMMVAFHDINIPTVAPVWNRLALEYSSVQVIGRDYKGLSIWQDRAPLDGFLPCGGIGVLFK